MDSTKKDQLLRDNFIVLLPDDEHTLEGPATLYMVPRDAITAWINCTPVLNEAMDKVRKLAFSQAFKAKPEKMKKFMEGDDSQLDNELFTAVTEDPKFKTLMTTIHVAALIDFRNTMGHESFDNDYTVSDPEILDVFGNKAKWTAFDSKDGWATGDKVANKVHFKEGDGKVSVESLD